MAKIDSIVQVFIERQTKFPSLDGFGTGATIAEFEADKTINPLLGDDRYQLYSDTIEMINDGWDEEDLVFACALDYFSQSPNPGIFMVGRKDPTDASWTDALTAIQNAYSDWYGFTIITRDPDDVEEVSVWSETQIKIFGYTSSQLAMGGIDDAATSGFWRTGDLGTLSLFQTVTDGSLSVSLDGGTTQDVTGIDFTAVAGVAGYFTSGDASGSTASFLIPVTDGEIKVSKDGATGIDVTGIDFTGDVDEDDIAATMEAAIQAADTSLTGVTVVWSSPNYIFTSDTTGSSSTILLTDVGGAGTNLLGTGFLEGGSSTLGIDADTTVATYAEIAEEIQASVQELGGSFTTVTVTYDSDDERIIFKSSTTGSSSNFVIASVSPATGTDLFGSSYLNGGYSTSGKDAVTAGVDDLATTIKALNYDRTVLCYSANAQDSDVIPTDMDFVWSAMIGEGFPYNPGSQTFAFKQLTGIPSVNITTGVYNTLQSNYVNFIDIIANITHVAGGPNGGKVMSGEYIDIIRGTDWLTQQIQIAVFSSLINNRKVPFTNAGIAGIKGQIFKILKLGYDNQLLDLPTSDDVIVPDINDVTITDRASRTLTNVTFTGRYAGAIQKVEIRGTLTV